MFGEISRIADFFGVLLFLILIIYFYSKPEKTHIDKFLLTLVSCAFLIDTVFIVDYYYELKK